MHLGVWDAISLVGVILMALLRSLGVYSDFYLPEVNSRME